MNPTCESESSSTDLCYVQFVSHSGFPSSRINLSPFTKDFRGGEQLNESIDQFFSPCLTAGPSKEAEQM